MDQSVVERYFAKTPMLASLCSQNGWPDGDSLKVEVLERTPHGAVCAVSFEEILMGGSGCVAGRVSCWGRFRLEWDAAGQVAHAEREA